MRKEACGTARQAGGQGVRVGVPLGCEVRLTGGEVAVGRIPTANSPAAALDGLPPGLAGKACTGAAQHGRLRRRQTWRA